MEAVINLLRNYVFKEKTVGGLFNQYNQVNLKLDQTDADIIRQRNLVEYITGLVEPIKVVFVGVAPGFRGCRFSGVPFLSEKILLGKKFRHFIGIGDYCQSSKGAKYGENSATKVWTSLSAVFTKDELKHFFFWNIVPYHPAGEVDINRDPLGNEIEKYCGITYEIINILKPAVIACFGELPTKKLNGEFKHNYPIIAIPHPSRASYDKLQGGYREIKGFLMPDIKG